ncbi:Ig-like domain-containing protein, partial [Dyadobacter frigoris]
MSKMYRTFTLALLGILLLTGAARSVYAQCDPRFSGTLYTGTSSPSNIATILVGETATLNFNFGVGPLSGCTAPAGNIPGAITITISFPPNYGPSSSVVTGPQASLYNWTYDPVTNKLTGVNNALIPRGGSALFAVSVVGLVATPGLGTPLTDFQFTSTTSPPITDGNTGNNTASIGLNVDPKPPVTVPDTKITVAGTPTVISVLTNDTPGTDPIAPGTVLITDPADNTPKTSVTIPGEGTYTVNTTTGDVTFTPIPTFTGTGTPVSYTVKDVNGVISNSSTIIVTVTPAVPPTAVPDPKTTPFNTPVTITTISNDIPGSSPIDPTSVLIIDPADNTPKTSVTIPGEGTYVVNTTTGDITFTPVPTFTGTGTPVSYTEKDVNGVISNPAPITVTVGPPTPPTAVPDPKTTPFNTPVTITTISNDIPGSSPIDPTSVLIIDPADNTPKTSVTIPGEGTYVVNPTTGDITFTPVPTFTGTGTPVSYTEKDVNGVISNPAPITVTVGPPTPPTAVPDPKTTPFNTPVTITTISNDIPGSSPIDPTSVLIIDPADNTPKTSVTIPGEGTYVVNTTTGDITFTPVPTFTGTGTPVSYTEKDVNGVISNPAPITVTVGPPTPPTAVPDPKTTPFNTPVTITTISNDIPGSSPIDPTSVLIIDPADNTPKTSVTIPGEGTYVVNTTTGDITFTPVATFTGTATPVNYTEKDVNGVISNPAPITVTVTATPPVAKTDIGTSTNGNPAIVTVLTNDTPGSAPIDPTT